MAKKTNFASSQPVIYTPGAVFSEISFYTLKSVKGNDIIMENKDGQEVILNKKYTENILFSADSYKSVEEKTNTELNEIIKNNPNKSMSICYIKSPKVKSKAQYNLEVSQRIDAIKNAKVSDLEKLAVELIENPPLKEIPGEMRVIKGYHHNTYTNQARLNFIDMEDKYITKQVDPRTVQNVIVDNVKYILK